MKEKNNRLLSLDALRGFDMFFIMGGASLLLSLSSFLPSSASNFLVQQMGHCEWDGFAFYDLIFPLFLFLSGVSLPFSLEKQCSSGKSNLSVSMRIVKRGVILVLLGVIYNGLLQFDFENLRYASVLGRIGVAWMFAALLYVWCGRTITSIVSFVILLGYWALLSQVAAPDAAPGASPLSIDGCIVGYIDRMLLPGKLHLEIHDPEGILSTFPAVVTAVIGIFTGEFVRSKSVTNEYKKSLLMISAAVLLLIIAYIWNIFFPINKNLWTSSFVCCAAGWSLLLFALFYLIADVWKCTRILFFFRIIGVNSITIYLAQQFLDFSKPIQTIFGGVLGLLPDNIYSTGYWCCYVFVCWFFLYLLYRYKIFLKV